MHRELQWASGKLAGVNLLGVAATARAAYLGKLKSARELSTQALQIARENNFKDSGAGVAAFEALLEAEVGNFGQARERAATSLALSRKRTNLPAIAVALALTGDSKQAQGIVDELKRRYPVDTVANSVFIPCAQALLESNRGAQLEAYKLCSQPFGMNWALFISSCRSTCEASFTSMLGEGKRPQPNFKESSTTVR